MARRIRWSHLSLENKYTIFNYWNTKTGNKKYSNKLNQLFNKSVELISIHPKIGRISEFKNVRIKVIRDYFLIYEIAKGYIDILLIWDSRQNPEDLKRLLKKYNKED